MKALRKRRDVSQGSALDVDPFPTSPRFGYVWVLDLVQAHTYRLFKHLPDTLES